MHIFIIICKTLIVFCSGRLSVVGCLLVALVHRTRNQFLSYWMCCVSYECVFSVLFIANAISIRCFYVQIRHSHSRRQRISNEITIFVFYKPMIYRLNDFRSFSTLLMCCDFNKFIIFMNYLLSGMQTIEKSPFWIYCALFLRIEIRINSTKRLIYGVCNNRL